MLDNIIQYLTCSNYRIVYYENTSNTIQTVLFSIKEIFCIRPFDGFGVHISITLKDFWKLFRSKHVSRRIDECQKIDIGRQSKLCAKISLIRALIKGSLRYHSELHNTWSSLSRTWSSNSRPLFHVWKTFQMPLDQ